MTIGKAFLAHSLDPYPGQKNEIRIIFPDQTTYKYSDRAAPDWFGFIEN